MKVNNAKAARSVVCIISMSIPSILNRHGLLTLRWLWCAMIQCALKSWL